MVRISFSLGGGGALAVVAGQREEVDARARVGAHGGAQDDGVAVGGDDGAAGELGDLAGLEAHGAAADLALDDGVLDGL
jgi:hypothetical protein